jgi:type IV fimbrial biogenesis protein FimT
MTTLAVAVIILSLAVPSFSTIIKDNRQVTQANDLLTTLVYARSEAINRGSRISVCKSSDAASCAASGGWEQGWIAFVDSNSDANANSGEEILRVHGALSVGTTLKGDANLGNYISYVSRGNTRLISGTMQFGLMVECDDRGFGPKAQAITINATGRARSWQAIDAGATSCSP